MTASKMWALIVGLIVFGGGLVGAVYYRQNHPEAEIAKLVTPLTPPAPSPSKPATLPTPSGPAPTAEPEAAKPAAVPPDAAKDEQAIAKLGAPKLGEKPAPEPQSGNGEPPHFDVVRVEPSGDAVLAGKGDPNAKVALVEQGKVVAEAKADPSGHFVILPPSLKPGDHDLSLRQTSEGKPAEDSKQNVAVSVPEKSGGQVVVALAEPGKPTKVLSAPPSTAEAPKPPETPAAAPDKPDVALAKPDEAPAPAAVAPKAPDLAIRTAELENGNGFHATGVAAPGTPIELYLNGSHLARVLAGPDGQWSVTIKKGLTAGHYDVRADAIGPDQRVAARVEAPFDVPEAMAQAPAAPAEAVKPAPEAPAPEAKVAAAEPDVPAPVPPSAPNPSDLGLVPSPSVSAAPAREAELPSIVPAPRPDIAAAAKAAAQVAPAKAPPVLAVSPPAARPPVTAPEKMAVAPAKPAEAPPALTATAPRVETPKRAEAAAVADARPAPEKPAETPAASSNAVIEQVETALVVRGDNLWNISRAKLGRGMRYTQIYEANTSQIRDPRLIYPGQVFVLPRN